MVAIPIPRGRRRDHSTNITYRDVQLRGKRGVNLGVRDTLADSGPDGRRKFGGTIPHARVSYNSFRQLKRSVPDL